MGFSKGYSVRCPALRVVREIASLWSLTHILMRFTCCSFLLIRASNVKKSRDENSRLPLIQNLLRLRFTSSSLNSVHVSSLAEIAQSLLTRFILMIRTSSSHESALVDRIFLHCYPWPILGQLPSRGPLHFSLGNWSVLCTLRSPAIIGQCRSLILDHSYLVVKLRSWKIADTKVSDF
jgi:hypothetical protein